MSEYDDYEFGEEPDWRGEADNAPVRELDVNIGVEELVRSFGGEVTRLSVLVPFSHDPTKSYVGAVLAQGPDRKWEVEGYGARFNDSVDALYWYAELLEAQRAKMLAEEFEKSGIIEESEEERSK